MNPSIPVIGCTAVGIRSKTIEIKKGERASFIVVDYKPLGVKLRDMHLTADIFWKLADFRSGIHFLKEKLVCFTHLQILNAHMHNIQEFFSQPKPRKIRTFDRFQEF